MIDEKLLTVLRRHLKDHTEAVRNESNDEHDILPSLFSALLESQIAVDKNTKENLDDAKKSLSEHISKQREVLADNSKQLSETIVSQSNASFNELKELRELTLQQTQTILAAIAQGVDTNKQLIESTQKQNAVIEKKSTIILYIFAAAIVLLLVIVFKLFVK